LWGYLGPFKTVLYITLRENMSNYYKAKFWCWKCKTYLSWKDLQNNHKHPEHDKAATVRPFGAKIS
jgi:hypothetical protein